VGGLGEPASEHAGADGERATSLIISPARPATIVAPSTSTPPALPRPRPGPAMILMKLAVRLAVMARSTSRIGR